MMNIDALSINPVTCLNKAANPSIRQLGSVAREGFADYLKQAMSVLPSLQGSEITPSLHPPHHLLAQKINYQQLGAIFHGVTQCSHRLISAYQEVMHIAL